jgi:hypothetical protein
MKKKQKKKTDAEIVTEHRQIEIDGLEPRIIEVGDKISKALYQRNKVYNELQALLHRLEVIVFQITNDPSLAG